MILNKFNHILILNTRFQVLSVFARVKFIVPLVDRNEKLQKENREK